MSRNFWGKLLTVFIKQSYSLSYKNQYKDIDKNFSEKVAISFYVEDFNSTTHNVTEGEELYKEIKLRFLDASFNVR